MLGVNFTNLDGTINPQAIKAALTKHTITEPDGTKHELQTHDPQVAQQGILSALAHISDKLGSYADQGSTNLDGLKQNLANFTQTPAEQELSRIKQAGVLGGLTADAYSQNPVPTHDQVSLPPSVQGATPAIPTQDAASMGIVPQLATLLAGFAVPRNAGAGYASAVQGAVQAANDNTARKAQLYKYQIDQAAQNYGDALERRNEQIRLDQLNRSNAYTDKVSQQEQALKASLANVSSKYADALSAPGSTLQGDISTQRAGMDALAKLQEATDKRDTAQKMFQLLNQTPYHLAGAYNSLANAETINKMLPGEIAQQQLKNAGLAQGNALQTATNQLLLGPSQTVPGQTVLGAQLEGGLGHLLANIRGINAQTQQTTAQTNWYPQIVGSEIAQRAASTGLTNAQTQTENQLRPFNIEMIKSKNKLTTQQIEDLKNSVTDGQNNGPIIRAGVAAAQALAKEQYQNLSAIRKERFRWESENQDPNTKSLLGLSGEKKSYHDGLEKAEQEAASELEVTKQNLTQLMGKLTSSSGVLDAKPKSGSGKPIMQTNGVQAPLPGDKRVKVLINNN